MLPLQLFLGTLLATALLVSVAQHERRQLQLKLRDYAQKLTHTEDESRRQAAQDLQDGIAQVLIAIRHRIDRLRLAGRDPALRDELDAATVMLAEAQRNARGLMAELRPPGLYELGLPVALDALVLRLREQFQLSVRTEYAGRIDALPLERRLEIYRIARELLTNVVLHSGVQQAELRVSADAQALQLVVSDQGKGFDPEILRASALAPGFGLFGIRDRVQNAGGALAIDSAPGRGCRISVSVSSNPLQLHGP